MSTNYYFKIKNSDEIKNEVRQLLKDKKLDFVLGEKILNYEGWIFNDTIHIGKSYGDGNWSFRPLFEQTKHYSSVKELLEFYENNKDRIIIESECYGEITFEELKENMFIKNGRPHEANKYFKIYFDEEGYQFGVGEFS
jgi:hypothetical protein